MFPVEGRSYLPQGMVMSAADCAVGAVVPIVDQGREILLTEVNA
jgi:hypothetical protein